MFLNNYYKYLDKVFNIQSSDGNYVTLVRTDGSNYQTSVNSYIFSSLLGLGKVYYGSVSQIESHLDSGSSMSSRNFDLIIGSGTTPVTEDDYKLENQLLLAANEQRCNITYIDDETGRRVLLSQKTYTNNTDSTVSISEIGFLVYPLILMYREVLDNPISLLKGESVTISLKRFLN